MEKEKEKEIFNQTMCTKPYIRITKTEKDAKSGVVIYFLENGSHYCGEIKDGMPNGLGKEYGDQYVYEGNFLDGKWHGKGKILKFISERVEYNGEFINGYFCGI